MTLLCLVQDINITQIYLKMMFLYEQTHIFLTYFRFISIIIYRKAQRKSC